MQRDSNDNSSLKSGVAAYLRDKANAVIEYPWQIVENTETAQPGQFKVFAMTSPNTMQTMDIIVPRTFFAKQLIARF